MVALEHELPSASIRAIAVLTVRGVSASKEGKHAFIGDGKCPGVIFSGGFGLLKKVNFKLVRMNTCVESGSDEHKKGTHDRGLRSRAGTT